MDQRALAEEIFQNRTKVKVLYLKYHPDKPGGDSEKFVAIRNICDRLPTNWHELNHEDFKDCLRDLYADQKVTYDLDEDDLKMWLFTKCPTKSKRRPEPEPCFSRICDNCSRVFYGSSRSCKSCSQTSNPFREPTPSKNVEQLKRHMQQDRTPIKTFKKFKKI